MRYANSRRLHITTPEGVTFSFQLAGPVTRFMAWLVDFFVIAAANTLLSMLAIMFLVLGPGVVQAATIIGYFVLNLGYNILMEWRFKGQTFGKRVMKIRVMDEQGLNLQLNQIIIRNLFRAVDSLPLLYLVGGVIALLSNKAQRSGDIAGSTVVVHSNVESRDHRALLQSVKYNSFSSNPHLEARLRQLTSPVEFQLVIDALTRRDNFDSMERIKLYAELVEHFKSKVIFPADITENLTDEQYLRNVVDSIYK